MPLHHLCPVSCTRMCASTCLDGLPDPGAGWWAQEKQVQESRLALTQIVNCCGNLSQTRSACHRCSQDKFHVLEGTTHAVVEDRVRNAEGSCLIASGETGPLLCPAWASSGTCEEATYIWPLADMCRGRQCRTVQRRDNQSSRMRMRHTVLWNRRI